MFSCPRNEIDPSVELPDIAYDILSKQRELKDLWSEYAELAMDTGLVDSELSPEKIMDELESTLMRISEGGNHSILRGGYSDIDWREQYGMPKAIRYSKEGIVEYTLDSGETFTQNE